MEAAAGGASPSSARNDWLAAGLAWGGLLLLPIGRIVEGWVIAMAIGGLWWIWKQPRQTFSDPRQRLFAALFLSVWIPMLLSLPDAVVPARTAQATAAFLRLYLCGVAIVALLGGGRRWRLFELLCAITLAFWVLDGWVQVFSGHDLFGFAPEVGRINALFGERAPKFSLTLAMLAPLLVETMRKRASWLWSAALAGITVALVLIAGTRSGWISSAVLVVAYAIVYIRSRRPRPVPVLLGAAVSLAVLCTALYLGSSRFRERIDQTIVALTATHGSPNAIDHRYWIWKGALRMYAANPINGVGARNFRVAYRDYAAAGDPYLARTPPVSPTSSHQLVLEVGSETGTLGLLGLSVFAGILVTAVRAGKRARGVAPALCLLIALFPLNTHLAFYSAFPSQLLFWLAALFCAAWMPGPTHRDRWRCAGAGQEAPPHPTPHRQLPRHGQSTGGKRRRR